MSSATGRKPTDAGSLLTGRRRIPYGDADFPAPQALPTPFLPTLPRQATPDVFPPAPFLPHFLEHKKSPYYINSIGNTAVLS